MAETAAIKRLMITKMTLENFKSYAGMQSVGPFHKNFSSVVGPNGSGKSNVIDAMLFVFGRRANQLRFKKVSELIHNSSNHTNLEYAKVSVHFQEVIDKSEEEYEVVPNSSFTVSRTAHRSNTSDYYIDSRKVSAKEVTAVLKGKGIDLDNNRFLILQGEVEQIAMMKPKADDKHDTGLLEYLEDIIGTDKYIEPIEQEGKRLEEINERRQVQITRLKVVEKDKDALESKKLAAEAYMAKQAERLRCNILGNKVYMHHAKRHIAENEDKSRELNLRLDHEKGKYKDYDRQYKEIEGRYKASEKAVQQAKRRADQAAESFKEMERQDARLRLELKHLNEKLKQANNKLAKDQKAMATLSSDMDQMSRDIPECLAQAEQLTKELVKQEAVLEAQLEGIKSLVESFHQQLSGVRAELAPWEAHMQEAQSRIDVASSERQLLARKQQDAKGRLETAVAALQAARHGATAKDAELKSMERAVKEARRDAEQARAQLAAGRAEEAQLEAGLRDLAARAQQLKAESTATQSGGAIAKALMAAKQRGEIKGIHGRLGDLGAIDARYDVAVSTACPALDFIVVDTEEDALRCVELLRRSGLGVSTFLMLEKQRGLVRHMEEKVVTPEGVPRLFDLVKVKDPALRVAFWYAMRNTVVAKDLEQASRIAYGQDRRFAKVVTLEGQLIAESGTMSGGGARPRGGRMALGTAAPRQLNSQQILADLAAAERELAASSEQLKTVRDRCDGATAALQRAEAALSDLEVSIPKARMGAEGERTRAAALEQRMQQLEREAVVDAEVRSWEMMTDARQISDLDKRIKKEEAELAKLRGSTADLQAQAAALEAKIEGAGGEKLKRQRQLVSKLQQQIDDAESDATKKGVQVKASQKQLDKLRKAATKLGEDAAAAQSGINQNAQQMKTLDVDGAAVLEQQAEAAAQLEERTAEMERAKAEKEKKLAEVGVIKDVQSKLEETLEELRRARAVEASNVKKWATAIEADLEQASKYTEEPLKVDLSDEELSSKTANEYFLQVTYLEEQLRTLDVDLTAIEEYRKREADYNAKQAELKQTTDERDQRRLDEFLSGFREISSKLKEMYQMITLGGDAELELVDTLDPFSEGIVFSVRPPKKSWKNISNLSGGEKTLSSLSLVFALHHYKPTPLYVMDEIDAALDFKNVSIVGHYIKERTRNAQFVIISLRNNMFELADRLVGIYKTDNCTKTVTINPGEFVVGAPRQQGRDTAQQQDQAGRENALPAAVAVA